MALELVLKEQSKVKSKSTYSIIRAPQKYEPNLLLTLRATFSNIRARYQRHPEPNFQRFRKETFSLSVEDAFFCRQFIRDNKSSVSVIKNI